MRLEHQDRLRRKELRKLLPVNKDDVAAIEAVKAQGYPAVQLILLDLLKWIRNDEWPVAKAACEFLATIGPGLAPQVREVFGSSDDVWKAIVLRELVSGWPSDDVRSLSVYLFQIAIHGRWGSDLVALRVLAKHGIDPPKIAESLEYKRVHHERRLSEIAEIRRMLPGQD